MFNRKKLFRERLEIYLTHLMLAYRPFFLFLGLLWAACTLYVLTLNLLLGIILLPAALLLLGIGSSFDIVVLTAKGIAWLAALTKRDYS